MSPLSRLGVLLLVLVVSVLLSNSALAGGETEYKEGLQCYKSKNYRSAAKKFESALASGNGSAENYLYMAHSYAASGDTAKAVQRYADVTKIFKDMPAAKLAATCLNRIDPKGLWRARLSKTTSSGSSASVASGKKHLVDRIYVLPPAKGHPPVNPHTVHVVKQTLLSLPKHIYNILDAGGTTINVGPNIIDKWPDAIYGAKPGEERMTLSEEAGRTYDRAVYLWERGIDLKTERLKPIRRAETLRKNLIYVLGHAYNDCLGPLTSREDFKQAYTQDELKASYTDKARWRYFFQPGYKGCGDVFCAVFASEYGGVKFDRPPHDVLAVLPRSTRYIKRELSLVNQGGHKPKEIIASNKIEKPKDPVPHKIKPKTSTKSHVVQTEVTGKKLDKPKAKEPFKDFIPDETKIHYQRAVGDRHYLRGSIEGKPVYWMLDTGAFETIVGRNHLEKLGIETPPGPPTSKVGGVAGSQPAWDMELNITVGDIRKRQKVKVVKHESILLLGLPFLQDMNYSIDRTSHYITFTKKDAEGKKHTHGDTFEIPFRMIDDHIVVIAKINKKGVEMIFDTGAPDTLIGWHDDLRIHIPAEKFKAKGRYSGTSVEIYQIELDSLELGPIRRYKMPVLYQPSWGGSSILGQDFFGNRKFVIDNKKNVIRFVH